MHKKMYKMKPRPAMLNKTFEPNWTVSFVGPEFPRTTKTLASSKTKLAIKTQDQTNGPALIPLMSSFSNRVSMIIPTNCTPTDAVNGYSGGRNSPLRVLGPVTDNQNPCPQHRYAAHANGQVYYEFRRKYETHPIPAAHHRLLPPILLSASDKHYSGKTE
jgi:hypothetical protein